MEAALLWNCQWSGVLTEGNIKTVVLFEAMPYSLVDGSRTYTLSQPVTAQSEPSVRQPWRNCTISNAHLLISKETQPIHNTPQYSRLLQKLTLVQACNLKVRVFAGHATHRDKLHQHSVLFPLVCTDTSHPRRTETLSPPPKKATSLHA